jgi:endonuclease/exonuclease/phosphatase family metal-dependent hydrolase
LGGDGHLSPGRIAEVIAECEPDIVALQELDVHGLRSGHEDQPAKIAKLVEMRHHFHPAMQLLGGSYGNAILTTLPSHLLRTAVLPAPRGAEPRGAIWVQMAFGGHTLDIVTTHLGLTSLERRMQSDVLLGPDWLGGTNMPRHLVVAGDFNCLPRSRTWNRFAAAVGSTHQPNRNRADATFPSRIPLLRLDHVFATPSIEIVALAPVITPLTRIASDHLPLLVEFNLR